MNAIKVELSNRQSNLDIDSKLITDATRAVLEAEGVARAEVSLAVVDDLTIHDLNRRFLSHDYPTDVLSFLLGQTGDYLEGEVVASADTAVRSAADYDWPAMHELVLYVIHGTLHLLGYDDDTPEGRQRMRRRESRYLNSLGITPPRGHATDGQQSESSLLRDSKGVQEGADKL